jgi:integrase
MKQRFILYRRGRKFYCEDTVTRKQESLRTNDRAEALTLLHSKNESFRQPALNVQIAKVYLSASDSGITTRTWQHALDALLETKQGSTQERWKRAARESTLDHIRNKLIIETQAEHFLHVLKTGTVSTNVHLRKLHNFCLDMNWLPRSVIPKKQWPAVRFKDKRAITWEEHCRIVEREKNQERKSFYQLAWHLGASQSDLAHLQAEDVDWSNRIISFFRMKTRWRRQQPPQIRFGKAVEEILMTLPQVGPLFPYLVTVRAGDRATEFKQRCVGLGILGVSLHSYRYAWAERAKVAGYPERFAQEALGHNSKAVHRAYAKKAQVTVPSLEEYERQQAKIVPMQEAVSPSGRVRATRGLSPWP